MDTKNTESASYIGLLFQIQGGKPTNKLWDETKREAIKYINQHIGKSFLKQYTTDDIYFISKMPCGELLKFKTPKDIMDLPIQDIPCPCGDKTHWLVKFVSYD